MYNNIRIVGISFSLCYLVFNTGCQKEEIHFNEVPISIAGNAITAQLPNDSVKVSGKGTDADGKVVGYLWSEVTGPNAAVIVNPGSSATTIKGLVAGSYKFQLMVIDDKGATGLDTMSVTVLPLSIQMLSLQPNQNPTEVHIWGNSTNEEGSSAGAPELGGNAWTHNGNTISQRGLVKFDLSTIPVSATIKSAKLTLYSNPTPFNGDLIHANYGTSNSLLIQQVITAWTPSLVKWNNQPSVTTTGQIVIPHTNNSMLDLVDVDVTSMVGSMVNNNTNYGFMIKLQNEIIYNSRLFCSSFYSNVALHPKLVIEYTK